MTTQYMNKRGVRCIGAIDGTHIKILAPLHNKSDYWNRKDAYTINEMAVCDVNHRFFYYKHIVKLKIINTLLHYYIDSLILVDMERYAMQLLRNSSLYNNIEDNIVNLEAFSICLSL